MAERKSGMVKLRGGFSGRNEIAPRNTTMQIEEFDDDTRVLMYNTLYSIVDRIVKRPLDFWNPPYPNAVDIKHSFCKYILEEVFREKNQPDPNYGYSFSKILDRIENVIKSAVYNEALDIIEYSVNWFESMIREHRGLLYINMNQLFEQEYVGYRFIRGRIVAITDENEIEAIEKACNNPFEGCRAHIHKALGFLADRENKDYKNSIKESISAVESICKIMTNEKTLSDALKKWEKSGITIHPALREAFKKLYVYTSDQGGIRHAEGMFESDVSFEDAEFMLVSCSAFVNYLIVKYNKGKK